MLKLKKTSFDKKLNYARKWLDANQTLLITCSKFVFTDRMPDNKFH